MGRQPRAVVDDPQGARRPPGAGGYHLIPTWRPACEDESNDANSAATTTLKVDLPAKLNRVVGVIGGDQITTQAPHGLRAALCAGVAVHLVDAGCPVPLTPQNVEVLDEMTFRLLNPCVKPAAGMALHAAPLLQAAHFSDGGNTVTVRFASPTDRGGRRGVFACAELLQFTRGGVAVPGTADARCTWRTSTELVVTERAPLDDWVTLQG